MSATKTGFCAPQIPSASSSPPATLYSLSPPDIAVIVLGTVVLTIALASAIILVVWRWWRRRCRSRLRNPMDVELPTEEQNSHTNSRYPWPRREIQTTHQTQQQSGSSNPAVIELNGGEVLRAELHSPEPAEFAQLRNSETGSTSVASARIIPPWRPAWQLQGSKGLIRNSINNPPSGFDSREFGVPYPATAHDYRFTWPISSSTAPFQPLPGDTSRGMFMAQLGHEEKPGPGLPTTTGNDIWSGHHDNYMLTGTEIYQN